MDPEFDAFVGMPMEIRMYAAFDALERNIGNGGWSQVLWNCHGSWRKLIAIAREGYLTIGAMEQATALDRLQTLCERDEAECRSALLAKDRSGLSFSQFTSRSYGAKGEDWERLFCPGSNLDKQRLDWLEANEARLLVVLEEGRESRFRRLWRRLFR